MKFKKRIIIFFCIIEIMLMGPRTISYILIDLIPIRIFSLPIISFSFFISIFGYIFTELIANNIILRRLIKFRFMIFIWFIFIVLSALINPIRDVFFESQGILIFMMNVVTFSVASVYIGLSIIRLILGMFISIGGTILIISYILFTDPTLLPKGFSDGIVRFEGLFSSTSIIALVAISTAFITLYKTRFIKLIGIIGILISLSGLFLAATRSTFFACFITLLIVLYYSTKSRNRKNFFKIFFIVLPITFFIIFQVLRLFPALFDNIEYTLSRITELSEDRSESGQSRMAEFKKEIELFKESPIIGHCYGILNMYTIPGFGNHLFGHNFFSSLLARTGFIGFISIIWYGFNLFSKIKINKKVKFHELVIIAKAGLIGAIVLISVSNFSGFQTFGIYGALVGIGIGINVRNQIN